MAKKKGQNPKAKFYAFVPKNLIETEQEFDAYLEAIVNPLAKKYNAKAMKAKTSRVKELKDQWCMSVTSEDAGFTQMQFEEFGQELAYETKQKENGSFFKERPVGDVGGRGKKRKN